MENLFCPECKGELKPIYRNVYKMKGKYRTIDGALAKPHEWLCESCKKMFKIENTGIIC